MCAGGLPGGAVGQLRGRGEVAQLDGQQSAYEGGQVDTALA